MNETRTLYIHCGLHKTGTTSLQGALRFNSSLLQTLGFLYPHAGCLDEHGRQTGTQRGAVHRNLAWHLAGSRLYRHAYGDLGMLAQEVTNFHGHAIISCEDFEWLLDRPAAFIPLQKLAKASERVLTFVIYLRNQIEYCESLFYQLVSQGAGSTFDQHATSILETGKVRYKDWIFQFDYESVLLGLQNEFGPRLIVRNYHDLLGGSIISDFCGCLGIRETFSEHPDPTRRNRRLSAADALRRFMLNRGYYNQTVEQRARTRLAAGDLSELKMSDDLRKRFVHRFSESNRRVCRNFGISEVNLVKMSKEKSYAISPSLDDVFSFETQCFIAAGRIPEFVPDADRLRKNKWIVDMCARELKISTMDRLRHVRQRLPKILLRG